MTMRLLEWARTWLATAPQLSNGELMLMAGTAWWLATMLVLVGERL